MRCNSLRTQILNSSRNGNRLDPVSLGLRSHSMRIPKEAHWEGTALDWTEEHTLSGSFWYAELEIQIDWEVRNDGNPRRQIRQISEVEIWVRQYPWSSYTPFEVNAR